MMTRMQRWARWRLLGAVLVAVLAVGLPAWQSQAQPLPPNRFFGRATLDGQPAAGAAIAALIGTTTCGSTTADGAGNYRLDVLSSGERPGCGTDGATVSFTVGGVRASQTGTWRQGEFTPLDLTAVRATPTPTPPAVTPTPPVVTPTPPVVTPTPAVTPTVTPRLPVTGSGGGSGSSGWLVLALAGVVVASAGSVLALRRLRS